MRQPPCPFGEGCGTVHVPQGETYFIKSCINLSNLCTRRAAEGKGTPEGEEDHGAPHHGEGKEVPGTSGRTQGGHGRPVPQAAGEKVENQPGVPG